MELAVADNDIARELESLETRRNRVSGALDSGRRFSFLRRQRLQAHLEELDNSYYNLREIIESRRSLLNELISEGPLPDPRRPIGARPLISRWEY